MTYEYTTVLIDTSSPDNIRRTLNDMGRNGWKLILVTADRQYIFERAKVEEIAWPQRGKVGPSETKVKVGTGPLSEAMARAQERRGK